MLIYRHILNPLQWNLWKSKPLVSWRAQMRRHVIRTARTARAEQWQIVDPSGSVMLDQGVTHEASAHV